MTALRDQLRQAVSVEREAWIVFDDHGDPYTIANTKRGAIARQMLVDDQPWPFRQEAGWTCRRVRITEIPNG